MSRPLLIAPSVLAADFGRLAEEVRRAHFGGRGMTVQMHPSFTYEDFVVGPEGATGAQRGILLKAIEAAARGPFLLHIDEIGRADLSDVLGEAIYLFEPAEVGGPHARRVRLPHPVDGREAHVGRPRPPGGSGRGGVGARRGGSGQVGGGGASRRRRM